jgi:cobalt-zinc-cadmium efflux system protein
VGHGHANGHGHSTAAGARRQRLVWVLAITLAVAAVQVVGGVLSGSLALLADAAHMVSDSAGIAVALAATWLAARPATKARTFGMQRAEILAALVNAVLLGGIAVWVLVTAVGRWSDPPEVETGLMLAVAIVGAVANAGCLLLLREGQSASLNLRGAYLEVMGDLLGSVAVIVAGVVIATTGWTRADSVASIVIGLMILPRAWALLAQVVDVLLEATPSGVDLDRVRDHMRKVPGVLDVHDLHAWTITSGVPVLSAHVVVDEECIATGRSGEVLDRLGTCLAGHFDVEHCTFQLEPVGHQAHEPAQHA